ncbi:MAG TPA: protein-L-isoaspartate O-methyltransferase [Sphingomicrobium sp.]|jgi:protein-L-isoaspartate(D-aspartate) O-methyltransferase|nr:protein-L-isoaspartate O-methyltransferase [Sphingomicrobium sp.]
MDYQKARRAMIDSQLRPEAVTDSLVIAAMATVPREQFVPEEVRQLAYMDRPVPLGEGRFLMPPATLGRMLTEMEARPGERALVIGPGAAYAAAVLSEMGLEVRSLTDGDLTQGLAGGGPYDVIILDGAVEFVPETIVAQLAEGGRLGTCLLDSGVQRLVIGRRAGGVFGLKTFADASAAPLPGFAKPPAFIF